MNLCNELISENINLWKLAQDKYGNAGFKLTKEELSLNNNVFDVNWGKAVETYLISSSDREMFIKLAEDLTSIDFDKAISNFEKSYQEKDYKDLKLSVYQNIVKSLVNTNSNDPSFFMRFSFDCGLAVVGFVGAFISLATLTAATGGLGVGLAVVGYCGASVSLVRSCRK